jgi:hypothetical protein
MSASESNDLALEHSVPESTQDQLDAEETEGLGDTEHARGYLQRLFTSDQDPFGDDAPSYIDVLVGRHVPSSEDAADWKTFLDDAVRNILSAGPFWETFSVEDVGKATNLIQAVSFALFRTCRC